MNIFLWLALVSAVSFVWLKLNKRFYNDLLSPFNVLLPTWVIPLLLCLLRLSTKEPEWHWDSILMLVYTTVMLACISLIPALLLSKRKSATEEYSSFKEMCALVNSYRFTVLMTAVYIVSCVAVVYNEILTNPLGGAPFIIFMMIPDISREAAWLWKGDYWYLSVPVFALLPFYYIKVRMATTKLKKYFYLALLFFYPVVALLKLSRSEIIYALTGMFLMHFYWNKAMNKNVATTKKQVARYIKRGVVIVVVAIISSTVFQELRSANSFAEISEKSNMGFQVDMPEPFRSTLVEVYTYFALPYHNFVQFVNDYNGGYHPGTAFLRPLYSLAGQGESVQKDISKINYDSYLRMFPSNTYPFLEVIYAELGWLGILIAPVVYALFVNALYVWFRVKKSFVIVALYFTVMTYQWLWMFSNTNFTGIQFYFFALFPVLFMAMYNFVFGKNGNKHPKFSLGAANNPLNNRIG